MLLKKYLRCGEAGNIYLYRGFFVIFLLTYLLTHSLTQLLTY